MQQARRVREATWARKKRRKMTASGIAVEAVSSEKKSKEGITHEMGSRSGRLSSMTLKSDSSQPKVGGRWRAPTKATPLPTQGTGRAVWMG